MFNYGQRFLLSSLLSNGAGGFTVLAVTLSVLLIDFLGRRWTTIVRIGYFWLNYATRGTMFLKQLAWIPHLWEKLICSCYIPTDDFGMRDLPEEILIDILSRLPGDCVLECRKVCKQWLALTSTPNFVEMHLKRATPILFGNCTITYSGSKLGMFIVDEGAKGDHMIMKMGVEFVHQKGSETPQLCGSCNGLLVVCTRFSHSRVFFICNPLTGERVTLRLSLHSVAVCGFFFDPLMKDYRLLLVQPRGIHYKYFIYSLGTHLCRKLDDFSCVPDVYSRPITLNGALHWVVSCKREDGIHTCSNSIMMFNIGTEKFHSMRLPRRVYGAQRALGFAYIFEWKGKLAFCHVYMAFVYLWVLEDYENWIWGERYSVDLYLDVERYPFYFTSTWPDYSNSFITLVDIQNDELLVDWTSRGLFRYNLLDKTVKHIHGVGMKQEHLLPFSNLDRVIISYTKTLVSPSDFK